MDISHIQLTLQNWFRKNQRSFPWREDKSPYKVWISEVMLQQTRASVVIPYFKRWMEKFPTIEHLAKSAKEDVLKAWEGLGYYSRARNLHIAAQQIMEQFQGEIPDDPEKLSQIQGIGPYTQGAILSFAFNKKAAAIDANVTRVISRLFCLKIPVHSSKAQKILHKNTMTLLENLNPSLIMEALIELGALICNKAPLCSQCPLQEFCGAKRHNLVEKIPQKKGRKKIVKIQRAVFICHFAKNYWVFCEQKSLMNSLWHFPYVDFTKKGFSFKDVQSWAKKQNYIIKSIDAMPLVKQFFTQFSATLYPFHIELAEDNEQKFFEKLPLYSLDKLPFSSGHRKILKYLQEMHEDTTH